MKSKSGPTDRRDCSLRVWTHAQARAVLPYVTSIMGSLREHRLEFLRHRLCGPTIGGRARQAQSGYTVRPGRGCPRGKTEPMRSAGESSLS